LLFSALTAAAFPPFGLWGLVFVAPLPLVWAAARHRHTFPDRRRDRLRFPLLVALGVLPLWAYEQVWVSQVSAAGYVPMILTLAGFFGMFAWLLAGVCRWLPFLPLSLTFPVLWAGVEFFRGEVFFGGLPWLLSAHPTIDAPLFPATASLLGTYFTSFLVAVPSGAAADLLLMRPRRVRPAMVAVGALAGCLALARFAAIAAGPPRGELRIAVVQTNIPQDNKMDWEVDQRLRDFARFAELTRQAASASPPPHLIVWPETMVPGEVLDPESVEAQRRANLARNATLPDGREVQVPVTYFADELIALQEEVGIPMLVGAMATTNLRFQEQPDGGFTLRRPLQLCLPGRGRARPPRALRQDGPHPLRRGDAVHLTLALAGAPTARPGCQRHDLRPRRRTGARGL
jgi:apolipoprotein N-acyltransferase